MREQEMDTQLEILLRLYAINNNGKLFTKLKKSFGKKLIGEINHQFMNYNKLNKVLKWKPSYKINDGLELTFNWYRDFLSLNNYRELLQMTKIMVLGADGYLGWPTFILDGKI